jgi:hypothetical protein
LVITTSSSFLFLLSCDLLTLSKMTLLWSDTYVNLRNISLHLLLRHTFYIDFT